MTNQPTSSYRISDNLYLNRLSLNRANKTSPKPSGVNQLICIDCSGSMSSDLPKIRDQLKKRIPKLLGVKDTISIIWFSGRGQCGVLLQAEPVATLTDLQSVNAAIDRWLQPVGMTGFKEPVEMVARVISEIKRQNSNVFSLFFMSDGCDNQWSRSDILQAVEKSAGELSAATFVEYGYYADRPLLTAMAEKSGGVLIFSQNFDTYQPQFESALNKSISSSPRIEVRLDPVSSGSTAGAFAFTLTNGDLVAYSIEDNKVLVPEDTHNLWYLTTLAASEDPIDLAPEMKKYAASKSKGRGNAKDLAAVLYAAVSLYSVRMKSDIVFQILKCLGDVNFINKFSTCFGKQKYTEYMDLSSRAAFDPKLRYTSGYNPDLVPADDAFTVLDLLQILASSDENYVLVDHPEFAYDRIGRRRVDVNEENGLALEFVPNAIDPNQGYSISNLTYNEDRPNISILVRKTGTVDLSGRLAMDRSFAGVVPTNFSTFIYRNYAIVKDGLVNVDRLPVRVNKKTADLVKSLMPPTSIPTFTLNRKNGGYIGIIDVSALPIINRQMVSEVSARVLFEKQWELLQAKAAQKVYKYYLGEVAESKESASFKLTYGVAAAEWLKQLGFTDYSGFSPQMVLADATDAYLDKELKIAIKGLSSLPTVEDAKSKIGSAKGPTISASLMIPAIKEAEAAKLNPGFKTWVERKVEDCDKVRRGLLAEMAKIKMAIIVGQVWFKEFSSIEENEMSLNFGGFDSVKCTVEMKEVEVKI